MSRLFFLAIKRDIFPQDIQMANKYRRKCSEWLVIREMKIKTIRRYDFTPVKMAVIKKTGDKKVLARMWRKKEPLSTIGRKVNCCSHYMIIMEKSQNIKEKYHMTHNNSFAISKENKILTGKDICNLIFIGGLFIIAII